MTTTSCLSKAMLAPYISFPVGWLGGVVVFVVPAIVAFTNQDHPMVRSSLMAMESSAWFVIVQFCQASFIIGFVQAIGTKWFGKLWQTN